MSVQDEPVPPVPEHTPPKKEDEGTSSPGKYFSHVWTRWFVSLREKVNVLNESLVNLGNVSGGPGYLYKDGPSWQLRTLRGSVGASFDGGGNVITVNHTQDIYIPFDCTIVSWSILASSIGNITINVWRVDYSGFPPGAGNSITGGNDPNINNSNSNRSSSLGTWVTYIPAGSTIRFRVASVAAIQQAIITLEVAK